MKTRQTLCLIVMLLTCFSLSLRAQTANVSEGCAPLTVAFSTPTGPSYFWDFKDGAESTLQNPNHAFTSVGTFDVEFREVMNGPVLKTITITVYAKPIVAATTDPESRSGCAPLSIDFQNDLILDPNLTVTSYNWVFGDGASSDQANPNHIFQNAGTYPVSLEIETNIANCQAIESLFDVEVSSQPNTSFITNPNPPTSCTAPLLVSFTNTTVGAGLTYLWDFGNGVTSTSFLPPDQNYTVNGLYEVQLTATDALGCSRTVSRNVSVGPPVASFVIPDTVCIGVENLFTNNSAQGAYLWEFGPNASPNSSSLPNPIATFNAAGPQQVTLTVTANGGCVGDTTITVFVDDPDPTFTTDPSFSCSEPLTINFTANSTIAQTYEWTFQDDSTSMEMNPVHSYFNDDTTIYSINGEILDTTILIVTNPSGCSASFIHIDTLNEPNALFMIDVIDGCAPLNVIFSDSSTSFSNIVSWEYDFGDGAVQSFTNDDDVMHTFTDPGEYDVVLNIQNANGCVDTSYAIQIQVGTTITPDFSVDKTTVCPGDTVHFTDLTQSNDIDAWHFDTEGGRTFHCFQENELFYAFDNVTGPQDVSLTVEYNGCFSTTTQDDLIQVNGPIALIDYKINCEDSLLVNFTDLSMDATSISWDFGDTTTSDLTNLVHQYDSTGDYTVILTAENSLTGCPASMDTMTVFVRDIKAQFAIDSFICLGDQIMLDGGMSQDVEASCWRGFDWHFTFDRPITTQDTVTNKQFNANGDHTVTLVVTDINGCRDTTSQDVWVFGGNPSFTVSDDLICLPDTVSFTQMNVADTTVVSWEWDFGDGSSPSTALDPTHIYTKPETVQDISVTLTITDAVGCPWPTTQVISVYEPVSTITSVPDPNICVGTELEFTATDFTAQGSNLTFDWNFGNGETGTTQIDSATYNTAGTYEVLLNFQEIATGCESSSTFMVDVQDYPIAAFEADKDTLCRLESVNFTDMSNYNGAPSDLQVWNFDTGLSGTGPVFSGTFEKGTFEAELIVSTSYGCMDTLARNYTVIGPEGTFMMDKNEICVGESITFSILDTVDISGFAWDFGDGTPLVVNVNPVTHQYEELSTVAKLILTGENNTCTFSAEQPIDIRNVVADFAQDNVCFEDGVASTFDASNSVASTYAWNFGDGNTGTGETATNTYGAAGTYDIELIVTVENCADTLVQAVELFAQPTVTVDDGVVCSGDAASLVAKDGPENSSYLWTPAIAFDPGQETMKEPTTIDLTSTTDFQVMITDVNGCVNTDNAQIQVVTVPQFPSIDTTVCPGTPFVLPVVIDPLISFNWTTEQGGNLDDLSCLDCSTPIVTVSTTEDSDGNVIPQIYNLTVSAVGLDCPTTTADFNLKNPPKEYKIPNAFTPDSDGINDFFNVVLDGLSADFRRFQVFNRWGNLVYNNEDPTNGWDGFYKGKIAPSDVYLYHIELSIEGCPAEPEQGHITLIR